MQKLAKKISSLLFVMLFPVLFLLFLFFNLRLTVLDSKNVLAVLEKEKTYDLLSNNYDFFSQSIMDEIGEQPFVQEQYLTKSFQAAFDKDFLEEFATDQVNATERILRNETSAASKFAIAAQKKAFKNELVRLSNPHDKMIVGLFADEINKGIPDEIGLPPQTAKEIDSLQPGLGLAYSLFFLIPLVALSLAFFPAWLRNTKDSARTLKTAGWYILTFDVFFLIFTFLNKSIVSLVQLLLPQGNVLPLVKDDVLSPIMRNFENQLFRISLAELVAISLVSFALLYYGYKKEEKRR